MKKSILYILLILFSCCSSLSASEQQRELAIYADSIRHLIKATPNYPERIRLLSHQAFTHQFLPHFRFIAYKLYEEAMAHHDAAHSELGAYYIAGYYDKMHDADSLTIWVNRLARSARVSNSYDYYLERKAAIARALAFRKQYQKAYLICNEVHIEARAHGSDNGEIAALNSSACIKSVTGLLQSARQDLLRAKGLLSGTTNPLLYIDILSRLSSSYGAIGDSAHRDAILEEMNTYIESIINRSPDSYRVWASFMIDYCSQKSMVFAQRGDLAGAMRYIARANRLYGYYVDAPFWMNIQLYTLQVYAITGRQAESIKFIDRVTPRVLKDFSDVFYDLILLKAKTQVDINDTIGALKTMKYLLVTSDSIRKANSRAQIKELNDIYQINNLNIEKAEISTHAYLHFLWLLIGGFILICCFYIYSHFNSKRITALERLTARASEEAKANNIAKESLCMEISHDVRTPLNAVIGFAELLADGEELDKEDKIKYENIILDSSKQLLDYVNNILELSRLESGKIKYNLEPISIKALIADIINIAKSLDMDETQVSINSNLEPEQMVLADIKWHSTFLRNILINSDKVYISILKDEGGKGIILKYYGSALAIPLLDEDDYSKKTHIRNEVNRALIIALKGAYSIETDADDTSYIQVIWPHVVSDTKK